MALNLADLSEETQNALSSLAMKVELAEGKRFRLAKSREALPALLTCASQSSHPEVRSALERLLSVAEPALSAWYNKHIHGREAPVANASASQAVYRGSVTERKVSPSSSSETDSREGKKKNCLPRPGKMDIGPGCYFTL